MSELSEEGPVDLVSLPVDRSLWERTFRIAPLVVIGTREGSGWDLAPKHLAMPLGWGPYFAFVCTPTHSTYVNARRHRAFTVSFPDPDRVVETSLTATPREGWLGEKEVLRSLPTRSAETVEGVFLRDGYFFLECELERIVEGFGEAVLVVGRVVAAHARAEAVRTTEREDEELLREAPLLAYVDPGRYAEVDTTHAFPFPEGFRR